MFSRKFDFAGARPHLAPQPVDNAPVGDGDQPGPERTAGIIGMADGMDRQEDVLYRVFDVAGVAKTSRRQRAQIGRDVFEQDTIGAAVAVLCAGHELRPVALAGNPRVAGACGLRARRTGRSHQRQRR